jgi:cathepsin X
LGCNGGDANEAYEYINAYSISDETCSVYQAKGWTNGLNCTQEIKCKNCAPNGGCWAQSNYPIYTVGEYGQLSGELEMMNEIIQRGPIVCGMAVTQ